MKPSLVLLVALFGCGSADRQEAPAAGTVRSAAPGDSMPDMPSYPEPARGKLAVHSAGPAGSIEIRGEWPGEAGRCTNPGMLMVVAQEPGTGTIVLLQLPPGQQETRYPVTTVTSGFPSPPAAQVGVNLFRPTGQFSYQAAEGEVDLYALNRVASGRFAVTLREINSDARIRYAGAFREVPVKELDPAKCAGADSVAASPR